MSRCCHCHHVIVSLSPAAAPRCASGPPGRCARGAGPSSPCHLWHCDAWAKLTSCVCHRLAPAGGRIGCASRIAPRCTRQLPPRPHRLPSFVSPLPASMRRPPLFPSSRRGHGVPGHRRSPSILCARVCAWTSACQLYPPHFELSLNKLQFGVSLSAVPLRPEPAVAEGSHRRTTPR